MVGVSERQTEGLARDLLAIQGWKIGRPPRGNVLQQNEYKAAPGISQLFRGASKRSASLAGSPGDGYPDFLCLSVPDGRPVMVVECKAGTADLGKAVAEATGVYGEACYAAGHPVLAVGLAGQRAEDYALSVWRRVDVGWKELTYEGRAISWLPKPEDVERLLADPTLLELAPRVPDARVLAERSEDINRILREASVRDSLRPAYVGATMLALWDSKGKIRRDPRLVLSDLNRACVAAFEKAGKRELAQSLHIDEANEKLAARMWEILDLLMKLNVVTASFEHDYLGQLYEAFFRYTGGNTIGQYFTPRHVTQLMAELCQVTKDDLVIDPACGTGGFLIAALQAAKERAHLRYEDAVAIVRDRLLGYEEEPATAALCVANMILRGDGKSGVQRGDAFAAPDFPVGACDVALMNPPFPHKSTDVPPTRFVERALEALRQRGRLAVILPTSLLVKRDMGAWRARVLHEHTLEAVLQLPDELFQPYASATTSIVLLIAGVPHDPAKRTSFVRVKHDGLTLKKGVRSADTEHASQLPAAVDAVLNKTAVPGFSGVGSVTGTVEWSAGAYIPAAVPDLEELRASIDELLRRLASFYVRYAREIAIQRRSIQARTLAPKPYRDMVSGLRSANAAALPAAAETIGGAFDIYYGQKELHSREGIPPGETLVISPTEEYNGCYGWLSFPHLIEPPFVTVAQTGTIGEAFVQLEPCAVNDDCLVLLPKGEAPYDLAKLVIAAAAIRLERWRFNYGRKLTPARIAGFPMPVDPALEDWVRQSLTEWQKLGESAVGSYASK